MANQDISGEIAPVERPKPHMSRAEKEKAYEDMALMLTPSELMDAMTFEEALDINRILESSGNLGQAVLSESAANCRYNREVYDDHDPTVEDYIYASEAVQKLATRIQSGTHEEAEIMRIFRSARARIYFQYVLEMSD